MRATPVPIVLSTQHNAYYPKQGRFIHQIERSTWRMAGGIIALSAAIEEHLRTNGFFAAREAEEWDEKRGGGIEDREGCGTIGWDERL